MSILKIARMGHPVLRIVAEDVADPNDPEIQRLIDDMIETMYDAQGQGLAAPQVYRSVRLVVYLPPSEGLDEREPRILINPVITVNDDETVPGWEGCLSVPGLRGMVSRQNNIHLTAIDDNGDAIDEDISGHHARVVQHECDHLDGVLYTQRMTNMASLIFESEMPHIIAAHEAEDKTAEESIKEGEESGA
ncbi:MAG: peptide deformylase [Alphaproteobacteria bacterium]|jgi:peptide deformylase|nr:peptide deformylase [Alphaproteobacteria bacterium]MBT4020006.1 peptide deformylase [Alphaproteobacteria bacterium]MBT5161341.1 peptide deformylase [Alphaproteobacteria bacterium]MBT5918364.1 peptide deformylase [Alphaproteobacteria bacterium]MBT6387495.1 peptide deformylase [Alphaproteobacteria bacterium]